jgi:hypothetical protein
MIMSQPLQIPQKFTQKSPKNSRTLQEPYLLRQDPPTTPKISERPQNHPEKTILPLKASKAHIFATVTLISVILAPKFSKSLPISSYASINTCLLHID